MNSFLWQTGTPNVESGQQGVFWCATRGANGKIVHRHLLYCNAYVMSVSDMAGDPPSSAVPVSDDGEYAWTGWHEESCEQCETSWTFSGEVVAWMRLPLYVENQPL